MTQIKSYLGEIITYVHAVWTINEEGIEGSLAQYFGEGFLEYHPLGYIFVPPTFFDEFFDEFF